MYKTIYSYCDYRNENFGDRLLPLFLPNYKTAGISNSKLLFTGSVLDRFFCSNKKINVIDKFIKEIYQLYVFGTGYDIHSSMNKPYALRKFKIYALRGRYTQDFMEKQLNIKLDNIVLGDAGLLVRNVMKKRARKKYKLGIVFHYVDEKDNRIQKLKESNPDSLIISVREEPNVFLEKIDSCEAVISTALHPIIACDSLRIPNKWAFLPNANQVDMSHKFNDYYSCYENLKIKPCPVIIDESILCKHVMRGGVIDMIHENYTITDDMVFTVTDNLQKQWNVLLKDIEKDAFLDCCYDICGKCKGIINEFNKKLCK